MLLAISFLIVEEFPGADVGDGEDDDGDEEGGEDDDYERRILLSSVSSSSPFSPLS